MTVPIPVTLTGSTRGDGTFTPVLRLITQASFAGGRSTGNGSITVTQSSVPGAFTDFAVVPYGPNVYSDPAFSHVTSATLRAGGTGDTANQWQRLSVTVQAPNRPYAPGPAGTLYRAYDYARPGVTSHGMALGETQQIAYVQLEKTPPGADLDASQVGSNLFSLEQASYEGRVMYEPVGGGGETDHMSFAVSREYASCGEYSGKFVYQSPPATNSYAAVTQFGTYTNLRAKRSTYAALKYQPFTPGEGPAGNPDGTGVVEGTPIAAPDILTLRPLRNALVRVQPGVTYQAQVSVAAEAAGQQLSCAVLRYDANFNLIGTYVAGPEVATTGGYDWQQAAVQHTMDANAAWAAVVPRLTSGGASRVQFFVDEHRIWTPSTLATMSGGASPARDWQPPRQLIIRLRATRVNYAQNPAFQNTLWGWEQVKDPSIASTLSLVPGGGVAGNGAVFRIETAPTATLVSGTSPRTGAASATAQPSLVDRLKPDTVYTASVYVRPAASPVPVTVWAHDGINLIRGTSTPIAAPAADLSWQRLWVTFKTSPTFGGTLPLYLGYAAGDVAQVFTAVTPGTNTAVWVPAEGVAGGEPVWSAATAYTVGAVVQWDGALWEAAVDNGPHPNIGPLEFAFDQVLVEQADRVAPYFDGNEPSGDYLWEGAPGDSRSHYYRGKRVNQYRLDQILKRQLGVGGSYQIVYAGAP